MTRLMLPALVLLYSEALYFKESRPRRDMAVAKYKPHITARNHLERLTFLGEGLAATGEVMGLPSSAPEDAFCDSGLPALESCIFAGGGGDLSPGSWPSRDMLCSTELEKELLVPVLARGDMIERDENEGKDRAADGLPHK